MELIFKQQGFTLIELVFTVALAAIVMTMGVPSFATLLNNNRITTQTNDFIGALNLTRSEAVKRRAVATLCVENTAGTGCDSANSQWEGGWIIFVDVDSDDQIDADEVVRRGSVVGGNRLRSVALTNLGRVRYDSRGRIDDNGTFMLCDSRGTSYARAINVNGTGRAASAGNHLDVEGNAISCPTS